MLGTKRRTYATAVASSFAAIYAVLGLLPVSKFVGISSFLTFREVLSPLAGMLFGPLVGGFSMVLGTFVDFYLTKQVNFDFLDFVPDLVTAVTAGLAFTGRRKAAVALPAILILWYTVDPISAAVVTVSGVPVPFTWMHILAVVGLAGALLVESDGRVGKLSAPFVAAVVFASTMAVHSAGSILYENIFVRVNHLFSSQAIQANWALIFYLYPAERLLFVALGTLVSVPVLRSLARRRPPSVTST
jgi:hypothetical protein